MASNVYLQPSDPKGYMRGWEGWDHPERKFVLDQVKEGESLLDVGCGSGITYESIVRHDRTDIQYKGVDYSRKFIRACKEMFPRVGWEKQSANALLEPDVSWDVVYLRNTLECIRYYRNPIWQARRVAKRLVILTFWNLIPDAEFDHIKREGTRTWGNQYGQAKLESHLDNISLPWMKGKTRLQGWRREEIKYTNESGRELNRWVYLLYRKGGYNAGSDRGGRNDSDKNAA